MSVDSTTNANVEEVNETAIENKDTAVIDSVGAEEAVVAEVPEEEAPPVDEAPAEVEGDVAAAPIEEPAAAYATTETECVPETTESTETENSAEEVATETENAIGPDTISATEEEATAGDKKRDAPEDPAEGEESPKQKQKTDVEPVAVVEALAAVEAVQQ